MRRIRQSKTQSVWRDSMNSKWWSLRRFCKKEKGVETNSQKRKDEKEKEGMRRIRQSETQSVWRDSMTSRTEQTRHSQSPISKSKASV